ncbi:MAG: hypothetical protein HFH13_08980 [Dorea sp.]|nr:hypothetical protein [Dorea sp.]
MDRQKNNRKRRVFICVTVVIVATLIGIIIYLLLSRNSEEPEKERRNVVITPENVESVLEELDEIQEQGYYTVTMNPTWHFEAGNEISYDAVVENVATNTNDVYFDIVMEEDEEKVLYKSPVIPRGGRLEEIAFDEPLSAGTYNCVVIYYLIDENQNTLSTLRVALKVIVEG